ncbi:uncharacterized protein LOC129777602 [Toxorhynchites rutilus septentrionalis]|uniref:uncharacterized protein LOC129777602 n=1 Tax=Toxorhynchites rutilus septentrionalis TaxID=329112 RepID=UPI00247915AA|nr:uncharacterized protein LOC129777602 [Toxorhynchites rutilus septentrionalis]
MNLPVQLMLGFILATGSVSARRNPLIYGRNYNGRYLVHNQKRQPDRHHWHLHVPFIIFEVYEPSGLEVSMVQRTPNITFFGVEIFVNKEPKNGSKCDICLNTTTIRYGKFVVKDVNAKIKKGDILSYHVVTGNNISRTRHNMQRLWVTNSIIKKCDCDFGRKGQPATSPPVSKASYPLQSTTEKVYKYNIFSDEDISLECDFVAVNSLPKQKQDERNGNKMLYTFNQLHREIQVLEGIINLLKDGCPSRMNTNFVLLKNVLPKAAKEEEMMELVKSSFSMSSELEELEGGIRHVMLANEVTGPGVVFEMVDFVDKQKVLYYAKINNFEQFVDYDIFIKKTRRLQV